MKFSKYFLALCLSSSLMSTFAQANGEIVSLPTFKTMAESELRAETGVIPYHEDENIRKALQHRIVQLDDDAQNFVVDPTITQNVDVLPPAVTADLNAVPPIMREHVMNIAAGLQSSNPTEGLYIMLEPFGIDRNATNVQIAREQFSIGQMDRNMMQNIQQNNQQPRTPPAR